MKCPSEDRENAELLLAHASRKLDAERAAVLEQHLAHCPACREYAAAQFAVWDALDAWAAPEVSADFDRHLYQRIEQEVSWWDLMIRPLRPLFAFRLAPVAAAACLLIAAGVLMQRPDGTPVIASPQSAQVEPLPADQAANALQEMQIMQEFSSVVRADAVDPRM
jgi:anti-sigma factor RsiW